MMIFRTIALVTIVCFGASLPANAQPAMETDMNSTGPQRAARTHAIAKVAVRTSEAKPYDQSASSALVEITIEQTFTGGIEGDSQVRALQVRREDRSASMVSMQRVRGRLGGREGTFVLQGSEVVDNGKIKATWFVVPGSGTGELAGLRGEGGFAGAFGKGSEATLGYWFE